MSVLSMRQVRRAFTLVELLVVIAIIGVLVALLLPALSSARAAANASGSSNNMSGFGRAFELYANANNGLYSSGAFDHLRDGDVRDYGWVADVVEMKVSNPGKALDLGSRNKFNEKVADYMGASKNKTSNGGAWAADRSGKGENLGGKAMDSTISGVEYFGGANAAREIVPVYNSNYATTWHFSRGDPSASDGYASGSKAIDAGDGGLTTNHIAQGRAPAARIAMMGPARAGDGGDAAVIAGTTEFPTSGGPQAGVMNAFAGKSIVKPGDLLVESFNDGMNVSATDAFGSANTAERIHEFGDIEPLHQPKNNDGTGGFAPVLFADGHVEKILDTVTAGSTALRKGDSFLGNGVERNSAGAITGFKIDNPSYNELADQVWLKRLRVLQTASGSLNEDGGEGT